MPRTASCPIAASSRPPLARHCTAAPKAMTGIPTFATSGCGHAAAATASLFDLSVSLLTTAPNSHTVPRNTTLPVATAARIPLGKD